MQCLDKTIKQFILIVIISNLFFGVSFVYTAMAGSVTVSWDPNTESDLAGYRIYYGKRSRNYQNSVYVGNTTSYKISGLDNGERYFFAVTALDLSNNESDFSNEVDATIQQSESDEDNETETQNSQILSEQAYNYPNPFKVNSERTTIRYELFEPAEVTIEILDANMALIATLIKDEFQLQGEHTQIQWDGKNADGRYVANGIYFCNIRANRDQQVIKIAVTQ